MVGSESFLDCSGIREFRAHDFLWKLGPKLKVLNLGIACKFYYTNFKHPSIPFIMKLGMTMAIL